MRHRPQRALTIIHAACHPPPGWGLDITGVRDAIAKAKADFVCPRALVFINPGNPTGAVLSQTQLEDLLTLCHAEEVRWG